MTDRKKIYISLLPLFIIIVLILGAGYLLLVDEIKLPKFNKGPQIRRLEGFPTVAYVETGKTAEKQRKVIKSETELNEFLNTIDNSGMLSMRDKVNFDKEFIIAVASEVETVDNHRIKVKKVYENKTDKALLVSVSEIYPGETCNVDFNPHIGVDLVAINKTDWKIDFERVKDIEECGDSESTPSTD